MENIPLFLSHSHTHSYTHSLTHGRVDGFTGSQIAWDAADTIQSSDEV